MTTNDNDKLLTQLFTLSSKLATVSAKNPIQRQQLEALVVDIRQALIEIDSNGVSGVVKLTPLRNFVRDIGDRIERLSSEEISSFPPVTAMSTGFIDLDDMIEWLTPGCLTIVAGTSGVGKTTFALNVAGHALEEDKSVAIFSLRHSGKEIAERLVAYCGEMDIHTLRTCKWSDFDMSVWVAAFGTTSLCNVRICDSNIGINCLQKLCREMKSTSGAVELVIIDDLQSMVSDKSSAETRLRSFKVLAQELDCPVVVLSSLSLPLEGRPQLSDMADLRAIERNADVVLMIFREDDGMPSCNRLDNVEIIFHRLRDGITGNVPLLFDARLLRFRTKAAWRQENQ
jgi:replicative DNA helicase